MNNFMREYSDAFLHGYFYPVGWYYSMYYEGMPMAYMGRVPNGLVWL